MSRSRFGGFFFGRRLFNKWNELKSSSAPSTAPTNVHDFAYTDAQGIWKMRSTTQFPKSNAEGRGSSGGGGSPSYSLGLTSSLDSVSGQNNAWLQRTVDIAAYADATVRPVFKYVSGSSFTGDLQLDQIVIDGNTYSFESGTESFERSASSVTDYNSVTWENLTTATSGNGKFLRDSGGTGSGNTGRTDAANGSWYVYAETSGNNVGFPSKTYWLRAPQITLGSSPTFSYYEARYGATIGSLDVYLDVIA